MAEQPQGTEYTLQGVMRFLQLEWHNHERARNAWDIERAEMKAKIAKQEGECRSARKLNDSLDRQIRMLERALKHERAKNKAIAAGQTPPTEEDVKKEWNGKIGIKSDINAAAGDLIVSETPAGNGDNDDNQRQIDAEKEAQRDRSKQFLQKCVEELTYLLTPPAYPVPSQLDIALQNVAYNNQAADSRQMSDEMYQHQRRVLGQPGVPQLPSLPNHHPPPPRHVSEYPDQVLSSNQQNNQAALMARQASSQQSMPPHLPPPPPSEEILERLQVDPGLADEPNERNLPGLDAYGRPIPNREPEVDLSRPLLTDENDGWNFDEPAPVPKAQSEDRLARRPSDPDASAGGLSAAKSPPRSLHRRKSSGSGSGMVRRRSDGSHEIRDLSSPSKREPATFKVRFALRGHLDVVRAVIFTGGGSPSEPEICTTGDDGMIKRWVIPATYGNFNGSSQQSTADLDVQSYFTHRGHEGMVTCLASSPASPSFSTGGRAIGDGWIFSGGQDATIRVWERGRVDPKATLEGHTDAVWALCVLPATSAMVFNSDTNASSGNTDRILLASGSADRTIKIWAVSTPPQLSSPQNAPSGSRRGVGGSRRHSITSGSGFPSSPQPSTASVTPFHHSLIHSIEWPRGAASCPTCISPLGPLGENFVVSYSDSSILIFDTRTGEEVVGMASSETYDGTPATGINAVVVAGNTGNPGSIEGSPVALGENGRPINEDENVPHGATGSSKSGGVEGVVISGHEDRYVRFFDANSGQCTYSMLAHPSSIASLSLSPDGRELVSAGHDASLRFWSLEKRTCIQEITSHRLLRGEGVVSVVWSQDGRWVVSAGGDGVVKVFAR